MKSTGLHIRKNGFEILQAVLANMPTVYVQKLYWRILFVDGITKANDKENITSLAMEFNESKYGGVVSWDRLNAIATAFEDLYDILLIGSTNIDAPVSKDVEPETIYHSSDVVIELFDSSYYRIYSYDEHFINFLQTQFSQAGVGL